MIPSLPVLRYGFLAASVALHAWIAVWFFDAAPTQIEGGSVGSQEARLGNSFDDFATGVLTPDTDLTEVVQPVDAAQPTETLETLDQASPAEPLQPPEVTETPVSEPIPLETEAPRDFAEQPQIERALTVETVGAANVALPTPIEPETTEVVETPPELALLQPAATPEPLEAAPVEVTQAEQPELETLTASEPDAPVTSVRPQVRPREIERPRQEPATTPRQTAPRGNASQSAVAGSTTGTTTATAVQQSANTGNAASEGNAAATNYPGVVMREISGVPRPRVRASSVATVRFVISRSGGLSSVSIARSSGNANLDAAALQVIRSAAPFPAPPAGAQRTFTIRIRGRG